MNGFDRYQYSWGTQSNRRSADEIRATKNWITFPLSDIRALALMHDAIDPGNGIRINFDAKSSENTQRKKLCEMANGTQISFALRHSNFVCCFFGGGSIHKIKISGPRSDAETDAWCIIISHKKEKEKKKRCTDDRINVRARARAPLSCQIVICGNERLIYHPRRCHQR